MKAAVYSRYGSPHVVKVKDIPTPQVQDDEVLIRVYASTVNRTDCGFRSAEYFVSRLWSGLLKPKFATLGCEFAGSIESIGKNVAALKTGDRVFGYNDQKFGGHAEYLVLKESDAFDLIPDGFNYTQMAPVCEGAHYALCIIRAAKVVSGQSVLVYGATGAIGSAAVQLLKYFGARVIAVCNTKNVALVKSLGADAVVDYMNEDFTATPERFDFIFDAVGKSSFRQCKPLLKEKGIYISTELGKYGANVFLALIGTFTKGKKVLFPIPTINKADVVFLKTLVAEAKFRPVIDRQYTLDQIVEAYTFVETGQKTGNVVITM